VIEDLIYRVAFGQADRHGRQPLELRRLDGSEPREHNAIGELLAWGSTETVVAGRQDVRLWAGLAAETFYVEPTVLQAVCQGIRSGRRVDLATWQPRRAVNAFAGTTVYTIVLEIPDSALRVSSASAGQIGF
jgi:hypothetical protein